MRTRQRTLLVTLEAFLSIQAQDFIEEVAQQLEAFNSSVFLSIQAQDFIEESRLPACWWSDLNS